MASSTATVAGGSLGKMRPTALILFAAYGFATAQSNPYFITTVAGNGNRVPTGDGGSAAAAALLPTAVTLDVLGNLYIADIFNHRILKVTPASTITTVAGGGSGGDGGPAMAAQLGFPTGVAIDALGNLFIAADNKIRKVSVAGVITTVVGTGRCGSSGDGEPAAAADICASQVAVDASGNLYISDASNGRVRKGFCRKRPGADLIR